MTSKIVVNNIESDTGIATVTIASPVALSGGITGTGFAVGTGASISSPATNVLTISTNNIERIRVGAAGSIGIGTDNPTKLIDMSGVHSGINTTGRFVMSPHAAGWDTGVTSGNIHHHYIDNFRIYSGQIGSGTERFKVDSSGRVTLPYQPTFYAWINSASVTLGSGGVFPFNATVFNVGSHFDTTTNIGRFTAPVSGYYLFGCTVADDDGAEFVSKIVSFYKNGGVYRDIIEGIVTMNAHFEIHQTALMQLNSGDYADVRVRSGSVTLNNGSDGFAYRCSFYGYLLG